MQRFLRSQLGGTILGLAAAGLITEVYYSWFPSFKTTTVVLTFLLSILISSTLWGLGVSVLLSVAAALCVDYFFLPPIGTFNINDPQDWVVLISFLFTSVIGSDLSARARRQAQEALRQRNEVARLYEFSQHLLSLQNPIELAGEMASEIVELFQCRSAAVCFLGRQTIYRSGRDAPELDDAHLISVQERGNFEIDEQRGISYSPVRFGTQCIGAFALSGSTVSRKTLEAISALIATAVDRARAIELLSKTEATRENERLKSVLLDAIAHDFKTPLTSIKAAATSLLEDLQFNKRQRGELLIVIDEECDRINRVIGQAIEMAQLDAGHVKLQLFPRSVRE